MYSMHKKNITHLFFRTSEGFLLTEFIIAFAVLSLAIVVCAHTFFSTVHEYTRAKQRLKLYTLAQNSIELSWSGNKSDGGSTDNRFKKQMLPVEQGIALPNMPKLKQEWLASDGVEKNNLLPHVRLRGRIRDE